MKRVTYIRRSERVSSMVPNPNPKGEGSNRSSALPVSEKKSTVVGVHARHRANRQTTKHYSRTDGRRT